MGASRYVGGDARWQPDTWAQGQAHHLQLARSLQSGGSSPGGRRRRAVHAPAHLLRTFLQQPPRPPCNRRRPCRRHCERLERSAEDLHGDALPGPPCQGQSRSSCAGEPWCESRKPQRCQAVESGRACHFRARSCGEPGETAVTCLTSNRDSHAARSQVSTATVAKEPKLPKLRARVRFSSPAPCETPKSDTWGFFVVVELGDLPLPLLVGMLSDRARPAPTAGRPAPDPELLVHALTPASLSLHLGPQCRDRPHPGEAEPASAGWVGRVT